MPPRCNCGAEAAHEHLLARDAGGGRGSRILGGSSVSLNGFIRSEHVRAWNYTVVSSTSPDSRAVPVHSVFTSKKPILASSTGEAALGPAGSHNESLFAALERDAAEARQREEAEQQPQQPASVAQQQQQEDGAVAAAANQNNTNNTGEQVPATTAASTQQQEDFVTLRSDADQELLIFCPFSEFLNIRGMLITCHPSTPPAEEPNMVSLFVNRGEESNRGFADVRRAIPAQNLRLGSLAAPGDAIIYNLDGGRFRSVASMSLFFKTSFGGAHSQVSRIVFFGETTREPVVRGVVTNVVTELAADPREHVRRLLAESNAMNVNRA